MTSVFSPVVTLPSPVQSMMSESLINKKPQIHRSERTTPIMTLRISLGLFTASKLLFFVVSPVFASYCSPYEKKNQRLFSSCTSYHVVVALPPVHLTMS